MIFALLLVLLLACFLGGDAFLKPKVSIVSESILCCNKNVISTKKHCLVLDATKEKKELVSNSRSDADYGSQAITVLKGLEPVRKRPGMYIGSTGQRGLHHLVFEVVDNSVDEALAGHCNEITVTLHSDGSVEVADDGRGIPCDVHPSTGKSSLETVLCVLHAGGKFGGADSGYKVSGGLHGVGLSVVNALSEHLSVQVAREQQLFSMQFKQGIPQGGLLQQPQKGAGGVTGTTVRFYPDPEIFRSTLVLDSAKLAARLDELAYLNAGLSIRLIDRRFKGCPALDTLRGTGGVGVRGEADAQDEMDSDVVEEVTRNSKSSASHRSGGIIQSASDEDSDDDEEEKYEEKFSAEAVIVGSAKDEVGGLETEELLGQGVVREQLFRHDGGIEELVAHLCEGKTPLHPEKGVITAQAMGSGAGAAVAVEVALRWSQDQYVDSLAGFANGIRTPDGGTHLDGLKAGVTKAVNSYAKQVTNELRSQHYHESLLKTSS